MAKTTKKAAKAARADGRVSAAQWQGAIDEIRGLAETNEKLRLLMEDYRKKADAFERDLREAEANVRLARSAMVPAVQSRRVVRELVIEGDPLWVASTLKTSMPEGQTVISGEGKARRTLTLRTLSDITVAAHDGIDPRRRGEAREDFARRRIDYDQIKDDLGLVTRHTFKEGDELGRRPLIFDEQALREEPRRG